MKLLNISINASSRLTNCSKGLVKVACEQALHLGLARDLGVRFGREPREDWGGGEVRRACRHDLRIFISTSPGRSEIPLAENDVHQSIFVANIEMC